MNLNILNACQQMIKSVNLKNSLKSVNKHVTTRSTPVINKLLHVSYHVPSPTLQQPYVL